jgi:hypothetical protein
MTNSANYYTVEATDKENGESQENFTKTFSNWRESNEVFQDYIEKHNLEINVESKKFKIASSDYFHIEITAHDKKN